jgi:saccharopine dehydrogenase-like NADP-dependent oxidoreductase
MLPADQHVPIAKACLAKGAQLRFLQLHRTGNAGVGRQSFCAKRPVFSQNEVGLDPGIDHLMAHDLVARYRASIGLSCREERAFLHLLLRRGSEDRRTLSATNSHGRRRGC